MKEDITVIKDCYLYKILDQNMYLSHGKCCKLRDKSGMYSLEGKINSFPQGNYRLVEEITKVPIIFQTC